MTHTLFIDGDAVTTGLDIRHAVPSPVGRRWSEGPDEGRMVPPAQAVARSERRLTPTDEGDPHPFTQGRPLRDRALNPSPDGRGKDMK